MFRYLSENRKECYPVLDYPTAVVCPPEYDIYKIYVRFCEKSWSRTKKDTVVVACVLKHT